MCLIIAKNTNQPSRYGDWQTYKDEKCFKIIDINNLKNFDDAKHTCNALEGSSLMSIRSQEEQDFLLNLLTNVYNVANNVWLGIDFSDDGYKWTDSTALNYTNWANGNPINESGYDCVQLVLKSYNGQWFNKPCNESSVVVCEKNQYDLLYYLEKTVIMLKENLSTITEKFQNTNTSLVNTITMLETTKIELEKAKTDLQSTKSELDITKIDLEFTKSKLENSTIMLQTTIHDLENTTNMFESAKSELYIMKSDLISTKSKLENITHMVEATNFELENASNDLQSTKSDLINITNQLKSTESELEITNNQMILIAIDLVNTKVQLELTDSGLKNTTKHMEYTKSDLFDTINQLESTNNYLINTTNQLESTIFYLETTKTELQNEIIKSTPAGTIAYITSSLPPLGWLKANGQVVSRATYENLFATIGIQYGSGDGSTTFTLPDLRGEFIRGWSDGRDVDSNRVFGSFQFGSSIPLSGHINGVASPAVASGFQDRWHFSGATFDNGFEENVLSGQKRDGITFPNDGDRNSMPYIPTVANGVINTWSVMKGTRPRNIALLACIKY